MMNKKTGEYLVLALYVLLLALSPFDAAGDVPAATPCTAKKELINTVRGDEGRKSSEDGVIQVVMPTNVEHVFDFIMDPQELIAKTDAAAYGGSRFEEDATLFFKRSDDEAEADYSSISDIVTIANKGEEDVTVIVTARILPDSIYGITMSDDPEFTDNMEASLYLALTDGEVTVPVDSEEGAVVETEIPGILEGEEPNEYSFRLVGAVNRNGDWSEVTDVTPVITVTWAVSLDNGWWEEEEEIPGARRGGEEEKNNPEENSNGEIGNGLSEESKPVKESKPVEESESAEDKANMEENPAADMTDLGESPAAEQETLKEESGRDNSEADTEKMDANASPGGWVDISSHQVKKEQELNLYRRIEHMLYFC